MTSRMKSKTLATWLAFFGGPLGLHRFYLRGFGDLLGWALPIPTALGVYGINRVGQFGQRPGRLVADQWRAAPAAAQVHQHQIAPVAQACQQA